MHAQGAVPCLPLAVRGGDRFGRGSKALSRISPAPGSPTSILAGSPNGSELCAAQQLQYEATRSLAAEPAAAPAEPRMTQQKSLLLRLLLLTAPVRPLVGGYEQAMLDAADAGYADVVRRALQLAERGGKTAAVELVNTRNQTGWTALSVAAFRGHTDVAQVCCSFGADVDWSASESSSLEHLTPLMIATLQGHATIVHLLLDAGASPNQQEAKKGQTALHMAAKRAAGGDQSTEDTYVTIARALLSKGAAVDTQDADGTTALLIASGRGATRYFWPSSFFSIGFHIS